MNEWTRERASELVKEGSFEFEEEEGSFFGGCGEGWRRTLALFSFWNRSHLFCCFLWGQLKHNIVAVVVISSWTEEHYDKIVERGEAQVVGGKQKNK